MTMLRQTPHPILLRYGCALLSVALIIICRSLLQPVLVEQAPLLLFTLAVMTSAWYGGLGPGLLATSLSTFAGVYFFIEPIHSLVIYDPKDKAVMSLFVGIGVMISLLSQSLHSSRRRVEEAARSLQESEDRYRRIVETAGEGIWMIDAEGRTSFVNLRMAEMLGYARDEMIGKSSFDHIFDEDKAEAVRRFENKKHGDSEPSDFRFRRKDGTEIWVHVSTSSIFDDDGTLLGVLGMFTDITERRRAEMERAGLLTTAQEARTEAERANRLKDEFLATVSHELRTPLASMLMWTRMLASGNLDAETTAQAHATLIGNVKLLSQLIEDLLDVSRIVSGKLRTTARPIPLIPVLEAAIEVVRPAAEAKNIKLETAFDLTLCEALADANRLQQVFWNLLSNAVKFTASGGSVAVKLEYIDSHARVSVSDTGVGICAEFLPHIFERFYQIEEGGSRRGLGLGLAIVRHIVEIHGGNIEAESEGEGRGATFTVRLPLIVDE
ncbi:MAG: PAS domain S-box protein [Pyrinomonadaceae bacterium MAG19_C2-C3]|nr:PAS domain S-box protein [Pyrinomonadaceae bacterium MAG19_C2-C3]